MQDPSLKLILKSAGFKRVIELSEMDSIQSRPIVESNKLVSECRGRGIQAERLFGEKEIFLND